MFLSVFGVHICLDSNWDTVQKGAWGVVRREAGKISRDDTSVV